MSATARIVPEYWPRARRALARRDALMHALISAHPRIALRSRGDAFHTLARSIVGQQISVKAADSVWSRLVCAAAAVTPAAIAGLSAEGLRACGLSGRKTEYLRDLARHFLDGSLRVHRWPAMEDEAVIAELTQVRGIGRWTAEMFLLFNLLRPDVLPLGDLGLRVAVQRLYVGVDGMAEVALVERLAEDWRPWRSVATWYLWRSLDAVPVEY